MDNREAIQLLDELLLRGNFTDQYGDMGDSSPYEEAVEIARQAIEKQMPKKPNNIYCPICKRPLRKAKEDIGYTGKVKKRKDVCFYGSEHEPKATTAWNRRANNEN